MSLLVVSHEVTKRTFDSVSPLGPQYSNEASFASLSINVFGSTKNCWFVGESMNVLYPFASNKLRNLKASSTPCRPMFMYRSFSNKAANCIPSKRPLASTDPCAFIKVKKRFR